MKPSAIFYTLFILRLCINTQDLTTALIQASATALVSTISKEALGGFLGDDDQVEDLKATIGQLERNQKQLYELFKKFSYQIDYLEKVILGEQIKDTLADINSLSSQMMSYYKNVQNKTYIDKDQQRSDYNTLVGYIKMVIPSDANRLSQSTIPFFKAINEERTKASDNLLNYYQTLELATIKLLAAFSTAINLLNFAQPEYILLNNIVEEVKTYMQTVVDWKEGNFGKTHWVRLVVFLLNDTNLETNNTALKEMQNRIKREFYTNIILQDIHGQHLAINGQIDISESLTRTRETITYLTIQKNPNGSIEDPTYILQYSAGNFTAYVRVDPSETEEPKRLRGSEVADSASVFRLEACENEAFAPEIAKDYFCMKNVQLGKYILSNDENLYLADFDAANSGFFWRILRQEQCLLSYTKENLKGALMKVCLKKANTISNEIVKPDIKSMMLGPNMILRIYRGANYTGDPYDIPAGKVVNSLIADLGLEYDIKSYHLISLCGRLYDGVYEGSYFTVCENFMSLPTEWSGMGVILSVVVPEGKGIILYGEPNYVGTSEKIKETKAVSLDFPVHSAKIMDLAQIDLV